MAPTPPSEEPDWLRRLACCDSEPPCQLCPLAAENRARSLRELADAGLKANIEQALAAA